MAKKNDSLFPDLPEDLSELSDEALDTLLQEHNVAADLIDNEDADFTAGLEGDELLAVYEAGVEQIEKIEAEQKARLEAQEEYKARKAELAKRRKKDDEVEEEEPEAAAADESEELAEEPKAESESDSGDEDDGDDEDETVKASDEVAVVASGETSSNGNTQVRLRRPPAPSGDRLPKTQRGAVLVAAAGVEGERAGAPLDKIRLAKAYKTTADRWGRVAKHDGGQEQRILIASASYDFPEERVLSRGDWEINAEKIAAVVPQSVPGMYGSEALVASGGLCAPLEPIYTIPNFATMQRPVRDALPSFRADRGGVTVGEATTIGDITTAISTITEENDALGGTFATKSCQDLSCPAFTDVPVTVIAHCREYGNLNAMAWPEKIAHENDLTMAAHARTADSYLLTRIKALSVNVTSGADTLGALIYTVDAIAKAAAGIRYRLRMSPNARFRVLAPLSLLDLLIVDTVSTQFDRYRSKSAIEQYLNSLGITVVWYLDAVSGGEPFDATQAAGALDGFTETYQFALYAEGTFIHVDGGGLELGIVRDSTLNSTNDYQFFGETFENVARVGPAQGAFWITLDVCPTGQFAPAGTARTCES